MFLKETNTEIHLKSIEKVCVKPVAPHILVDNQPMLVFKQDRYHVGEVGKK